MHLISRVHARLAGCLLGLALPVMLTYHARSSQAAEIDSFTRRYDSELKDALGALNESFNAKLQEVVARGNEEPGCASRHLYKTIRHVFGTRPWGHYEEFVFQSDLFDKVHLQREDSIYRDVSFIDGIALYLADLGAVVRVGNLMIGTDKFGHFIEQGYEYFRLGYLRHSATPERSEFDERAALSASFAYGRELEDGLAGAGTTSIKSHADLVANYNGMLWWTRLLGDNKKIDQAPYFICRNQKWVLNRPMDWSEYIDAGWDEGINCSAYVSPKVTSQVNKQIEILEQKNPGKRYKCPIVPSACGELFIKYQDVAPFVLSPICIAVGRSEKGIFGASFDALLNKWKAINDAPAKK